LSLGALLLMLDNSVTPDNAPVYFSSNYFGGRSVASLPQRPPRPRSLRAGKATLRSPALIAGRATKMLSGGGQIRVGTTDTGH
jgi:hypothetical protein